MPPINTTILIVGAGPAGLMLACRLANYNIDFKIIDNKKDTFKSSGALVLHPASLELFAQIGLAEKLVSQSTAINAIELNINNKSDRSLISHLIAIDNIINDHSSYPPLLLNEQNKTEELLKEFLNKNGVQVLQYKFISSNQIFDSIDSYVTDNCNRNYVIRSKYLIGADGYNSTVRATGSFHVNEIREKKPLFIMDYDIKTPTKYLPGTMSFHFLRNCAFGVFALNDKTIRVDGYIGTIDSQKRLSRDLVETYFPDTEIRQWKNTWFSAFKVRHLSVDSFRSGNVFLIGDAAHVHGPIGGQGMNSGFQDAVNLSWKLAFRLKGYAPEDILNTYSEERRKINFRIMRISRQVYKTITGNSLFRRFFRLFLFTVLRVTKYKSINGRRVKRLLLMSTSQLWIKYNSSLTVRSSGYRQLIPGTLLRTDYIPQSLRRSGLFKLLIICANKSNSPGNTPYDITCLAAYPLEVEVINYDTILTRDIPIKNGLQILLRPDNYIALVDNQLDPQSVISYFKDRNFTVNGK